MTRAALILALVAFCAQAQQEYRATSEMRETGYVLGDFLEQRVTVVVPRAAKLEPTSLPNPGPVRDWMELTNMKVETHSAGYTLHLTYQVFAAVEEALKLSIPEFTLRVKDGLNETELPVPAQPFYLSPVLPAKMSPEEAKARASFAPAAVPERGYLLGAVAAFVVCVVLALYLAWAYDRMPFLVRSPGPLTALYRRLRKRSEVQGEDYLNLLREAHSAFSRCAGETLYAANLPLLFERAPHLKALRERIEDFFLHSWQVFYEQRKDTRWSASEVIALCRMARDSERALQ